MFRYNRWANRVLIEASRSLTAAQLDSQPAGASGTIRSLLMHVVGGQQTGILRTKGRQHEGELSRTSAWPGFENLLSIAMQSSDELIAIAETLETDSEVHLPYMGKVYRFPKSFFLVHEMEHGVEHRTEIKIALAHLGIDTPDLDGWQYSNAAGYGGEVQAAPPV
jgi:uncharacterized damage-inducible protein DinB